MGYGLGRFAVHASAASNDDSRRAAVSERPQDVQQHSTLSARLHAHQCLVYRRWICPPRMMILIILFFQ